MDIVIRPLREDDLKDARRIMSRAFGTFIGLPEPERFAADQDYIRTRWAADPTAAFAAGVNMAREKAFRTICERGYRVGFQGIAMHRPNDRGYSRPGIFAIDDWR